MSTTVATQYINNINSLYPDHPGGSNNVQGFHDNFNNIQAALTKLDTYIDSLSATTDNTNTNIITGTQVVNALNTLQIGTNNYIRVGALNDIVVIGKNPDNTPAAGSVAFFPNVVPMSIESLSASDSSFNSYNTTTGLLVGATFYGQSPTTSGPYTITSIDGYTVSFSPAPTFVDGVVYVTNPTFDLYTVINANTVTTLLAEAFNLDVVFSAGIESTAFNTGTLIVDGGVGITDQLNIHGNLNITKDLNIKGNLASTSTTVNFDNLNITGNLIFTDITGYAEQVIMNTATLRSSIVGGDGNGGVGGGIGYQVLPSGLIMMWGTEANVPVGDQGNNSSVTITLPTIPGNTVGGFPHGALQVMMSTWNSNQGVDYQPQVISITGPALTLRIMDSPGAGGGYSGLGSIDWFAIGY